MLLAQHLLLVGTPGRLDIIELVGDVPCGEGAVSGVGIVVGAEGNQHIAATQLAQHSSGFGEELQPLAVIAEDNVGVGAGRAGEFVIVGANIIAVTVVGDVAAIKTVLERLISVEDYQAHSSSLPYGNVEF